MLITSAVGGEGKTTLAAQLAVRCAEAGASTVLIDADLRHATLGRLFEVPDCPGLSDVLRGDAKLEDALVPISQVGGCQLLPAGSPEANPNRILRGKAFAPMLEQLRRSFDVVIIDTSPVLPVPDALILGRLADGAVLATRHDQSRFPAVERANGLLAGAGIPVLGVVVNGARPSDRRFGGAGYAAYTYRSDRMPGRRRGARRPADRRPTRGRPIDRGRLAADPRPRPEAPRQSGRGDGPSPARRPSPSIDHAERPDDEPQPDTAPPARDDARAARRRRRPAGRLAAYAVAAAAVLAALGWAYRPELVGLVETLVGRPELLARLPGRSRSSPSCSGGSGRGGPRPIGSGRRPGGGCCWPLVVAARFALLRAGEFWLEGFTLVPTVGALVLAFGGWPLLRRTWPAVAFLVFMYPIPQALNSQVSLPLQRMASISSAALLRLLGFWVMDEGNVLVVGGETLEVAAACNGLAMLMSLAATIAATVILVPMALWKRIVLLLSVVPIALLCNVLRIAGTAWCYHLLGSREGGEGGPRRRRLADDADGPGPGPAGAGLALLAGHRGGGRRAGLADAC